MERFKWLAKKHWWKPIPIVAAVYFAIQWLLSGSLAGSQNMGVSELQDKLNHRQVTNATFHAADHELKVTLTDGSTRTVIYPTEYDDELTALLLSKNVAVTAENPNFFQENKAFFVLFGAGVLIATIVPMVAMTMKSRFIAHRKRVSDVPDERFSDVLGADEQITELAQLTDFIRNPDKYEQAGVRMPRGWLFTGPPGTGKTLLARALAGEAGVPFYAYSGSDFAASYVGEGATRVKEMFKAARNAAFDQVVIILIDEIDAVGAKRHGTSHESSVEILNQLLVELDGFLSAGQVVVIGATNRKDVLDPALLRPGRLSRHLYLPEPALPIRVAMLQTFAGKLTHLAPDISFDRLAKRTVGMSGAEIAEICNSAGLRALRDSEDTSVTVRHFELAIADHVAGQERPNAIVHEEDRLVAAVHEAGHALTGLLIDKAPKPDEITIVPRGQTGGTTWMVPEERAFADVELIKAHLAVLMGSRAAEKIAFDANFSTGAAHDIQRASETARRAICEAGMGNFYDWVPADDWLEHPNADQIAAEVEQWLRDAEEQASAALKTHRPTLEAIRDRLLEVETITGADLRNIATPALV